jgi:hypothetical protein
VGSLINNDFLNVENLVNKYFLDLKIFAFLKFRTTNFLNYKIPRSLKNVPIP